MGFNLAVNLLLTHLIGSYGQGFDASIPADTTFCEYTANDSSRANSLNEYAYAIARITYIERYIFCARNDLLC